MAPPPKSAYFSCDVHGEMCRDDNSVIETCPLCEADAKGEVYPGCPCDHEKVTDCGYYCARCGYPVVSR